MTDKQLKEIIKLVHQGEVAPLEEFWKTHFPNRNSPIFWLACAHGALPLIKQLAEKNKEAITKYEVTDHKGGFNCYHIAKRKDFTPEQKGQAIAYLLYYCCGGRTATGNSLYYGVLPKTQRKRSAVATLLTVLEELPRDQDSFGSALYCTLQDCWDHKVDPITDVAALVPYHKELYAIALRGSKAPTEDYELDHRKIFYNYAKYLARKLVEKKIEKQVQSRSKHT